MAMLKMPLAINGWDFSDITERLGYSVVYEDRKGGNSMALMNGDEYLDVIARKPVLTWRLDSLNDWRLAELHAAINAAVYVPVYYYDPAAGECLTAYFHGTISAQEIGVIRRDGTYRFRAPTLTLRAR